MLYLKDSLNSNSLLEATLRDLRDKTSKEQPKVVERSKVLKSYCLGFGRGGQVLFKTTAATTPDVDFWYQTIKIKLPRNLKGRNLHTVLFNSLTHDVHVRCNCPAFRYWGSWYYLATIDSLFGHKTRVYPMIRNPLLKGALCKHIYNVLGVISFNVPTLVRELKKRIKSQGDFE